MRVFIRDQLGNSQFLTDIAPQHLAELIEYAKQFGVYDELDHTTNLRFQFVVDDADAYFEIVPQHD